MKGTYRFSQGGVLIGEYENIVTTVGKRSVMQFLAGYRAGLASHIAVGAFNTAAALGDTDLNFEWARATIQSVSPDYTNTVLYFKARFPSAAVGKIYEAGLWSPMDTPTEYPTKMLAQFDNTEAWSVGQLTNTGTERISTGIVRLDPAVSATATSTLVDQVLDLSGYSPIDEFRIAGNTGSANLASIFVRFATDASNYYTGTVSSGLGGAGNYSRSVIQKSAFVATGSPNWANITQIIVGATATSGGSSRFEFDGLMVQDKDAMTDSNLLISRVVPGSPITMAAGIPMDVEYSLDVTV